MDIKDVNGYKHPWQQSVDKSVFCTDIVAVVNLIGKYCGIARDHLVSPRTIAKMSLNG